MGTRLFPLSACFGIALALAACSDDITINVPPNDEFTAEERFTNAVPHEGQTRLELENTNGNVHFFGALSTERFSIDGEKSVESFSLEDAEAHLDSIVIAIETVGDTLRVETQHPSNEGSRNYTVDYQIEVPTDVSIDVVNANGNVDGHSVRGDVTITAGNSNISLDGLRGSIQADLANGDITVGAEPPADGTIDLSTTNGDVWLRVPMSVSAQFSAVVVNGTIEMHDLVLKNPVGSDSSLSGTLGAGTGAIILRTTNGNILVEAL